MPVSYRNNTYKDALEKGENPEEFNPILVVINSMSALQSVLSDEVNEKLSLILEKGTTPEGRLKVIHDSYTTINSVDLTYLRMPGDFSVLTGVPCELPYTCFEELVSGATDLYVRHLTATQPKQQQNKE